MNRNILATTIAGALAMGAVSAQASLLIDDFNTAQSVTDIVDSPSTSTSGTVADIVTTDLTGADRTIVNEAFAGIVSAGNLVSDVVPLGPPDNGILSISANATSDGGTSMLIYDDFGTVNFAAQGTAIILDVLSIDLGVTVEMLVNGTSTSGAVAFTGPGEFFVSFADFSDPSVFDAVSEVKLTFSGNDPWDGTFQFLRTDIPTQVPAPATLALLGLGLVGLGWSRRNKA